MIISYNWLKDYLDTQYSADELSTVLTAIGLEVDGQSDYEEIPGSLEGLIAAKVITCEKHPNADKLKLTKVDTGTETFQVICGAPNVAAGQMVAFAPLGSTLHTITGESFKIKKAKIRGIESMGMICAEDEIGLGHNHDGIIILADDVQPGTPLNQVFDISKDTLFDIALTPNRSDAMSHIGVAHDLHAYFSVNQPGSSTLRLPKKPEISFKPSLNKFSVSIEDTRGCQRYSGLMISGITIAPSPAWLQKKLKAIGLKPINNVVDITNFILAETGQPLHAFDADKINGGKVIVKKLAEQTPFISLDGQERKLSSEDLMICDEQGPICMAGVFGGFSSGISETSTRLFLESACFHPVSIRRSALRHNLRTDAAMKFEKGTDPNQTVSVLKRAAAMICEIAGGEIDSDIIDVYPEIQKPARILFDLKYLERIAGSTIPKDIIKRIFTALEIKIVKDEANLLEVLVPTYRNDVNRPADLVEEVLRIYGFDNIPMPGTLRTAISMIPETDTFSLQKRIGLFLNALGFSEMLNLSITASAYQKDEQSVVLFNSLSSELDVMRKSMLWTSLESVRTNLNRRNLNLKLYEFGRTYEKQEDRYNEPEHLILALSGKREADSWANNKVAVNYFDLKSIVTRLLQQAGIHYKTEIMDSDEFAYGQNLMTGQKLLGRMGLLSAEVLNKMDIKYPVYYADIDWLLFSEQFTGKIRVNAIPKFPGIKRDLSMIISSSTTYEQIEDIGIQFGKKLLQNINLFDVYEGKNIEQGKKSYAVSFLFQDYQRTLNDQEIDRIMQNIIEELENRLQANIRKS